MRSAQQISFKRLSHLALLVSVVLTLCSSLGGSHAMEITDESTHEKVYSEGSTETAADALEKDLQAQPEESAPISPPEDAQRVKEEEPQAASAVKPPEPEVARKQPPVQEAQSLEEPAAPVGEDLPSEDDDADWDEGATGDADEPVVSVVDT